LGTVRAHKRLEHWTWRGKRTGNMQWRLACLVHKIAQIVHDGMAACPERPEGQKLHRGQPQREAPEDWYAFEPGGGGGARAWERQQTGDNATTAHSA
jgi:hypothetical protein